LNRGEFKRLVGGAGINDSAAVEGSPGSSTPITFSILGDGRPLWTSRPLQKAGEHQSFNVSVANVTKLQLVARCPVHNIFAHAAWINPNLTGGDSSAITDATNANPPAAGEEADAPAAARAAEYPAPDLSAPLFDVKKLTVKLEQRRSIADILTAHVRGQLKLDQAKDLALASRMLGIALRVDPENRD